MVAPGEGFRGGTLYRPKNRRRPPKKRSSLQNELVFSPKVCDDEKKKKKKGLCLSISGFSVSKAKKPKWCNPGPGRRPPSLATPLSLSTILYRYVIRMCWSALYLYKVHKTRSPSILRKNLISSEIQKSRNIEPLLLRIERSQLR